MKPARGCGRNWIRDVTFSDDVIDLFCYSTMYLHAAWPVVGVARRRSCTVSVSRLLPSTSRLAPAITLKRMLRFSCFSGDIEAKPYPWHGSHRRLRGLSCCSLLGGGAGGLHLHAHPGSPPLCMGIIPVRGSIHCSPVSRTVHWNARCVTRRLSWSTRAST